MKKLFLCVIIAAATFTGCKKEVNQVNPVSSKNTPMNTQKKPIVTVKQIPGAFVILNGDPASGTCWPTNGVCFTIISVAKSMTDSTFIVINSDFSEKFGDDESADLVINSSPDTTISGIKSIDLTYDSHGIGTFSYTH